MEPNSELVPRIGTFFIMIGVGLLILFVGSIIGQEIQVLYLLGGAVTLFLGWFFRRKAKPAPPSGRFGAVRKARERSRQRKEEKAKKKKK